MFKIQKKLRAWRRSEAQHCSSLCSQSEGNEYSGGQTRLKIQRRYALKRWLYSLRVRGPHFASKVSYNAGAARNVTIPSNPFRMVKRPIRKRHAKKCCNFSWKSLGVYKLIHNFVGIQKKLAKIPTSLSPNANCKPSLELPPVSTGAY